MRLENMSDYKVIHGMFLDNIFLYVISEWVQTHANYVCVSLINWRIVNTRQGLLSKAYRTLEMLSARQLGGFDFYSLYYAKCSKLSDLFACIFLSLASHTVRHTDKQNTCSSNFQVISGVLRPWVRQWFWWGGFKMSLGISSLKSKLSSEKI